MEGNEEYVVITLIKDHLTDKVKLTDVFARISVAAAFVFIAFGWGSGNTTTIMMGMFFLICFFGFLYANRVIRKQKREREFYGIDVEQHIPKPKV